MIVLLLIVLILGVPVGAGFVASRRSRRNDWRHFAAFVGFTGGIIAIGSTFLWVLGALPSYPSIARQGFTFVAGIVGMVSSLFAFVAGLLSRGAHRLQLVAFGILIGVIYLFGAFSQFGR